MSHRTLLPCRCGAPFISTSGALGGDLCAAFVTCREPERHRAKEHFATIGVAPDLESAIEIAEAHWNVLNGEQKVSTTN